MLKDRTFCFGSFELFADRATLYCGDKPVRIGSRAIEILTALVERAGAVVSGDDLIARTWPDTHVEENTLRVHLVSLRKALAVVSDGSQYIVNVPGRGYRFVQPVKSKNGCPVSPRTPLPQQCAPLFGRSHDVSRVLEELPSSRLLNIVGPAACGKTAVALAVAHAAKERFLDGIIFVDLSQALSDVEVTAAIAQAQAMAIKINGENERELLSQLQDMEVLMVFDNCEHVLERIAVFLESLLDRAPAVQVLATSQEALMIEHETQYRLAPLDYPTEPHLIRRAEDALGYASVQLFMHSVTSAGTGYRLTDRDAPVIAALCKHLEGKPLYIELAASAIACCSPSELVNELSYSLSALTRGQRTAPARQRTLRCSLDWAFRILSPEEQNFLICLALFDQPFDRANAMLLADFKEEESGLALELFGALVAKFWLTPEREISSTIYTLSPLARLYLREKLHRLENADGLRRRYVELVSPTLKKRECDERSLSAQQLIEKSVTISNWCSSPREEITVGEQRELVTERLSTKRLLKRSFPKSEEITLSEDCAAVASHLVVRPFSLPSHPDFSLRSQRKKLTDRPRLMSR